MSERYPGGIISKTPVTPSGPYANSTAPGVWTLDQQLQFQQAGNWPTQGSVDPSAFIENLFSTYLYTGNSANQSIVNGIDLSTYGGLVWVKNRQDTTYHNLFDTNRGIYKRLYSSTTDAQVTNTAYLTAFNSNGFDTGTGLSDTFNYVSWTFRKQAKFFDVVTYTGDGTTNQTINHNLGSTPGFIITKRTDSTGNWAVWHTSFADTKTYAYLNTTAAATTVPSATAMTVNSTYFTVGSNQIFGNGSGWTYVAYLFASNAGGFGSAGTDNVITCGSYTGNLTVGNAVTLGYEPQWVLVKRATGGAGSWYLYDTMRGMTANAGGNSNPLSPNTASAEGVNYDGIAPSATGFTLTSTSDVLNGSGFTYIYIAIRRGPMATPTTGTSVFLPATRTGTGATATVTTAISPVDMVWSFATNAGLGEETIDFDRLRGALQTLYVTPAAEFASTDTLTGFDVQNGYKLGSDSSGYGINYSGIPFVNYSFKRAPGFFDVVCYTSNYSGNPAVSHNLGVVPELLIFKDRNDYRDWEVYAPSILGSTYTLYLNFDYAKANVGTATTLTSTTFQQQSVQYPTGKNYIAYLFATIAGVSKVGSYTGNGTTQTINCGFGAGGVRFVLIKRTDSTGGWYVYDTARGMTVLTNPYYFLNSANAQVATLGSVTTVSTGFALNSTILAAINVNAGTYIFLAIA